MTHIVRGGGQFACVIMTHCVRKSICDSPLSCQNILTSRIKYFRIVKFRKFAVTKSKRSNKQFVILIQDVVIGVSGFGHENYLFIKTLGQ